MCSNVYYLAFVIVFCLVPSQVIVARTLTKKNAMMSVTTKVVMQLNCKLGGELWALEIPVSVCCSMWCWG